MLVYIYIITMSNALCTGHFFFRPSSVFLAFSIIRISDKYVLSPFNYVDVKFCFHSVLAVLSTRDQT